MNASSEAGYGSPVTWRHNNPTIVKNVGSDFNIIHPHWGLVRSLKVFFIAS